jgi:glutaconate CoA-transferase subunit A
VKPSEYDFVAARRRLETKAKSAGEKLTSLEDVAARVSDGDVVAVGGILFSRTPMALVHAILRDRRTGLTLVRNLMCQEGEFMMAVGAVERVVTAWFGIGLPWGVSKIMREHVEGGTVVYEEWSHLALGLRFRAAAMGLPFLPALTMLGSDLAGIGPMKTVVDPYTGTTLAAIPALYPDVALLHVHRADRFGNCQIDGYPHMDTDIARAAATVLVTAEELIPDDEVRRHPDRTVIPGFLVDAVALAPWGAFPHECYGLYEADFEHFDEYTRAIEAHGTAGVTEFLDRHVYAPASWLESLELWGPERLARQARRAHELAPTAIRGGLSKPPKPPSLGAPRHSRGAPRPPDPSTGHA